MNRIYMKSFTLVIVAALLMFAIPLHAEMNIKLKSGKVIKVPVAREQIESIDYIVPEKEQKRTVPEGSIQIESAKYGNVSFELGNDLGYKQYFCDAKPVMSELCDGKGQCKIIVGSKICGDPYPGRGKYLYVEYSCNGRVKRAKNTQTEIMRLKCP